MKSISISEALNILKSADAVMVDGDSLTFPSFTDDIKDYPALILRWIEASGAETKLEFYLEDNTTVDIDNCDVVMTANNGWKYNITPLFSKDLEQD